jgi:hypothetical protein
MANETDAPVQSGAEQTQVAPTRKGETHAHAPNPEQHLLEAHKLSIQVQGKKGFGDYAVWALIKEERGKTKTLAVTKGGYREAIAHFYAYIHPNTPVASVAPTRRYGGPPRSSSGGGRPSSGGGRPSSGGARPPSGGGGARPPQRPAR